MDFNHELPEERSVELTDVEMTEDGLRFSGYAAVFGDVADLGDFTEEIRRGAFRKVLAAEGSNVPMYWDHDPRIPPLATTRSGTLRLVEDATGLRVQADLDNDHYMTPTLRSMIRRGDVTGMSFGFIAGPGNSIVESRSGKPHRVLTGFRALLDVSPTWIPAYAGTSAEMRSALVEIRKARLEGHDQRIVSGEYPQADEGDVTEVPAEVEETEETEPVAEVESEEQRSGVDEADASAAARRRRLHMMGLTLPKP